MLSIHLSMFFGPYRIFVWRNLTIYDPKQRKTRISIWELGFFHPKWLENRSFEPCEGKSEAFRLLFFSESARNGAVRPKNDHLCHSGHFLLIIKCKIWVGTPSSCVRIAKTIGKKSQKLYLWLVYCKTFQKAQSRYLDGNALNNPVVGGLTGFFLDTKSVF